MRVAAILAPGAGNEKLGRFRAPEVDLAVVEELRPGGGWDAVLVFGGDGSVHRQLTVLRECHIPLLVIPVGSGNDFAHELRLNSVRRAWRAWRRFLAGAGRVREIDLGLIRELSPTGETLPAEHCFCSIAGIGLDAEANRRANLMPAWLRGHGGYAIAAVQAIAVHQFPRVHVRTGERETAGPITLAAFANSRVYGDGMKMAPRALLEDGLLDVCFVRKTSKFRLLRFFPSVFAGAHLGLPEVEYWQVRCARVRSEPVLDVYADGEYICHTPVAISIVEKALRVIV